MRALKKERKLASVAASIPVGARSNTQKTAENGSATPIACVKSAGLNAQPLPRTGMPVREQRPVAKTAAAASVKAAAQKVNLASRKVSLGASFRRVAGIRGGVVMLVSAWSAEQSVIRWKREFVACAMRVEKRGARSEAGLDEVRGRLRGLRQ